MRNFLLKFYGDAQPFITDNNGNIYLWSEICRFYGKNSVSFDKMTASIHDIPRFELGEKLECRKDFITNMFANIGWLKRNEDGNFDFEEVVRIYNIDINGKNIHVDLQHANYQDGVLTNKTLDIAFIDNDVTISPRMYDSVRCGQYYKFPEFSDSIMSNHIGVSTMLYANDNGAKKFLVQKRTSKVLVENNLYGPSVGGAMSWNDMLPEKFRDAILYEIGREIKEESGLLEGEYKIYPLSFCRGHITGGKPHFFFACETELDVNTVSERIINSKGYGEEHDKFEFLDNSDIILNSNENIGVIPSEGLLVSLFYSEDFMNHLSV